MLYAVVHGVEHDREAVVGQAVGEAGHHDQDHDREREGHEGLQGFDRG